jgi:hypothetical protein
MNSVYFTIMVGNTRQTTVEIRKVAENMTPPVWGYEITTDPRESPFRSTVRWEGYDFTDLARLVLNDYAQRDAHERQGHGVR